MVLFQNIKKQYTLKHNDNDNINNIVHSTVKIVFTFIYLSALSSFHIFQSTTITTTKTESGELTSKKKKTKQIKKKKTLVIRSPLYFLLSLWAVSEPTWKSEGTLLFICIGY